MLKGEPMKLVSVLLLLGSFAAQAQVTVDKMTCAQAQAYSEANGRYWVDAGPDGAIPIYPTYTLETVNCGGRTTTTPELRRTLDNPECIVSWYCKSY